ncbi:MAG: helix-turn-helix domain-containing protein [Candidatus Sericytochromatia bacterium]
MGDAQYSLAEVAKITGKSEKTISRWIKNGKLPAIRHGTGYLIDEEDIPLGRYINSSLDRRSYIQQRLLAQDQGEDSLVPIADSRRVDIHNLIGAAGLNLLASGQAERKDSYENLNLMLQKHQAEVEKIIREQNELAEKYARATYKIGQLEERNRLLEEQNGKLEQKMGLLPPPEQWQTTRQELERLKNTLHETESGFQRKLELLENQKQQSEAEKHQLEKDKLQLQSDFDKSQQALETERKKSFWQRLFGA